MRGRKASHRENGDSNDVVQTYGEIYAQLKHSFYIQAILRWHQPSSLAFGNLLLLAFPIQQQLNQTMAIVAAKAINFTVLGFSIIRAAGAHLTSIQEFISWP
uniref:Uncharacterized protein n=1 Tax=Glossina pallidipes TaxID=7398 RepID=A0A1A9ZVY0_GLOPL